MNPSRQLLDGQLGPSPLGPHHLDNVRELYAAPGHEPTLRDYWRILGKRKWAILVCALVMVTVVGLVSLRITPIYEAIARISFSGQTSNLLNFSDKSQPPMQATVPVQHRHASEILQSNTLALLVIRNLGLENRPQFAGYDASQVRPGAVPKLSQEAVGREEQLMQKFRGGLRVQQVPDTAIVEIKYSSPDPALAAEIANATAQSFIEQNIKARYDSTMQAADWLSKQLADLQIKVEGITREIGRVPEGSRHHWRRRQTKPHPREARRSQQGADASASRPHPEESLYEIAKGSNAESLGIVLHDPAISSLRQQQTDLEAQDAQLSTQFGSSYPKVQEIRGRLKLIKETYNKETQNGHSQSGERLRCGTET